ncbi:MAG: hypothetical protein P8Y39_09820 [Nitrospirota bacterium]|jgi:hypothetical protein
MRRAVGFLVLFALALTLLGAHICAVKVQDGETIATLDLCSPQSPAASGDTITLTAPVYGVPIIAAVEALPAEKPFIYESTLFSPLDDPPRPGLLTTA